MPVGGAPPLMGGWPGLEPLRVPAVPAGGVPPLTGGWLGLELLRVPAVPVGDAPPLAGGWLKPKVLCVSVTLVERLSPFPAAATPGGGEILGVPSCRIGLDVRACCCVLVCVLE